MCVSQINKTNVVIIEVIVIDMSDGNTVILILNNSDISHASLSTVRLF